MWFVHYFSCKFVLVDWLLDSNYTTSSNNGMVIIGHYFQPANTYDTFEYVCSFPSDCVNAPHEAISSTDIEQLSCDWMGVKHENVFITYMLDTFH